EILLGEYAFGIWEPAYRQFFGLRDLIGAKPFFFAHIGSTLSFSNTLDALRVVPGIDLRFDEQFAADFLLQGWCPDLERTVYRGSRPVRPGRPVQFRAAPR